MKKLVLFVLVLLVTGAGYYLYDTKSRKTAEQVARVPSGLEVKRAISHNLIQVTENFGLGISLLVPGAEISPSLWNFRGSASDDSSEKPFFGSVRNICNDFGDVGCWQIETFVVDGTSLIADSQIEELPAAPVEESPAIAQENSSADETGSNLSQSPAADSSATADRSNTDQRTIWRARVDGVNGRTGPGTSYRVAFKVNTSTAFELIERREDWGRFRYPAANGQVGEIWISMSLMQEF